MSLSGAGAFGAGAAAAPAGAGAGTAGAGGAGAAGAAFGASASPVRSSSTSEKMSDEVSGDIAAATWAVSIRMVLAPMSVASTASWTDAMKSSSEKGRSRMSNAPTFCASAFRLDPL